MGERSWNVGIVGLVLIAGCDFGSATGPTFPELRITTETLPTAVQNEPYSAGIDAQGGDEDYAWDLVGGALPEGLVLEVEDLPDNGAVISGIPETPGTATFTVRVRSGDGQSAQRSFTLRVVEEGQLLALENVLLPPALAGAPYDVVLDAVGGDGQSYDFEVAGGSLPEGLELEDGRIRGTPVGTDTATVTLAVSSGDQRIERSYTLAVVANRTGGYDMTVVPVTTVPAEIRPHLDSAVAMWEAVLTADRSPIHVPPRFFGSAHCDGFGRAINGTTAEDLLLLVNIDSIDGPGRVLGRAGPCGVAGDTLPFAGILTLDQGDLLPLVGSNTLTHIIAHEIGHVLGFGSLWEEKNLIEGAGTTNPRFTGPRAVEEYQALGGAGTVPVESQGGEGTADSHWRETTFDRELLTGFSEPQDVFQPLSRVSIGSLADLGYSVDMDAADPYSLPASLLAPGATPPDPWDNLGYDIVDVGPVRILDQSP